MLINLAKVEVNELNFELLKARKELGLTQEELASSIGMKRDRYNRIELGKTPASIEEALMLAKAVEKNVEEIFLPKNANMISKAI
jgi:DNA-binding XRE family transcriptional regulator